MTTAIKTATLAGALSLLLAPGLALAEGASTEGTEPANVLTKLHRSNSLEIEAGKLAQEKGQSKATKDYGKLLVKDHTAADKQVQSLAKQLKVDLPAEENASNDASLETSKNASPADFDKVFAASMVADHTKDIAELKEARDQTTEPKLKKLLTGLVPKLEKHQAVAQKLASSDGAIGQATGATNSGGVIDTATGRPGAPQVGVDPQGIGAPGTGSPSSVGTRGATTPGTTAPGTGKM